MSNMTNDSQSGVEQPGIEQRLGRLVTGREVSMFQADVQNNLEDLKSKLNGSRVLVVGGAGSIGSETTKLLARFELDALHIVDHSENYLADLIRDIRSDYRPPKAKNIRALPISYSGAQMQRFLLDSEPYNFVLNFAALKHVRSEKDVYSLFQMLDTNIVGHARFKSWLKKPEGLSRYFAVSTDKASNPTSLMGASKRIMEDVAFDCSTGCFDNTTSARFANVAFSNGSLPLSFLDRISKHHPLAAPEGCRRYFISLEEAGQICLLAGFMLNDGLVALPNLDPEEHLILLQDVAAMVLKDFGFEPEFFHDEAEAKSAFSKLHAEKRWPVLLTPLDTAGEKPYEEFLAEGEVATEVGLTAINGTTHIKNPEIGGFVSRLEELIHDSAGGYSVEAVVDLFAEQIGTFRHVQSQNCLDDRM